MLELLIVKGGSNVKLQDAQGPLRAGRSLICGWRPRLTCQVGRSKWVLNLEYWGNVKIDNLCYIGCLDPIPTTSYQQERRSGTFFLNVGKLGPCRPSLQCVCVFDPVFFEWKSTFLTGRNVQVWCWKPCRWKHQNAQWKNCELNGWWIRSNSLATSRHQNAPQKVASWLGNLGWWNITIARWMMEFISICKVDCIVLLEKVPLDILNF